MNERTEATEVAAAASSGTLSWSDVLWRVIHGGIVCFFVLELLYCAHQVFVVMQPPGAVLWLGPRAGELPWEMLVVRRLYAMEAWVAGAGLVIYLAITEVRPRLWDRGQRR